MKKTKILSAVCAAAVLTTMVASCGSDKGSNEGNKNSKAPELVYWTVGGATGDNQAAYDAVNEYVKDKLGFTIKVNIADWGDWDTKMNTIVQSGEYFDYMFTNASKYGTAVNLGAFADITEDIDKYAPKLNDVIPEEIWDGVKIDGKIYSVPTYKDSSITQYWAFDKSIVDKYGIDVSSIKTFADLDKVLRQVKEGEGSSFYPIKANQSDPFNGLFNGFDGLCAGLEPLGVEMTDGSRKVINTLEHPVMQERLNYMHSWYQDGIINPDAPTMTETPKGRFFMQGQGFPGAEQTWAVNDGVEAYVTTQVWGPMYSTESIQGSMNAIGKNSKYVKECLQFLELANTDSKLRDMMAYGAEGKDFEYTSDGVVKKLNDNYTWPSYTQATFFNLSTVEGTPEDQWDQVKKLNEEAETSSVLGFALDVEPINSELTACRSVYDKYKNDLKTGASDPKEVIPKLTKELKDAGFDTIVEEAQKQIDAYFGK